MEIPQLPLRPYPSQNVNPHFEGSPHVYPQLQPNLGVTLRDAALAPARVDAGAPSRKSEAPSAAATFSPAALSAASKVPPAATPAPNGKVTPVVPETVSPPPPSSAPTLPKAAEDQVRVQIQVHDGHSQADEHDSRVDENDSHQNENDFQGNQTEDVAHSDQPSESMKQDPSGAPTHPAAPYSPPPSPDNLGAHFNTTH